MVVQMLSHENFGCCAPFSFRTSYHYHRQQQHYAAVIKERRTASSSWNNKSGLQHKVENPLYVCIYVGMSNVFSCSCNL